MSISEKLITIAENELKVYEAGRKAGYDEGFEEGKTNGTEEGAQTEYSRLVNLITNNGNRTGWQHHFRESAIEEIPYPVNLSQTTTVVSMFQTCLNLKKIAGLNTTSVQNFNSFAEGCSALETIEGIDTSSATQIAYLVQNCKELVKITGKFDFTNITTALNTFAYCTALTDIDVCGTISINVNFKNSPNLSNETVQKVIDCLKDLTGQAAKSVTFHTDVILKLTEDQITQITNKNWNIA